MNVAWVDDVLHFWFDEIEPHAWFSRNERVDRLVSERFEALHERVRSIETSELATPSACLAAVIALDQFPRNMYRSSPRAYAADAQALAISQHAIDCGFDQQLDSQRRMFLYMPWQHSEDPSVQARSVELFAQIGAAEPLDYALQHKAVIDRFGRFPHRNAVLGRVSTDEEIEFMKRHPGF